MSVRGWWAIFAVLLAATVLADLFVAHETRFGIETSFAFSAWYGFLACVGLVSFAKLLGAGLKRPDRYYNE